VPDGWGVTNPGNLTTTIVNDAEVLGKALRMTVTTEAGGMIRTPVKFGLTPGAWAAFLYRLRFTTLSFEATNTVGQPTLTVTTGPIPTVGQPLSGNGIPAGTTVQSVAGSVVTMTNNSTATISLVTIGAPGFSGLLREYQGSATALTGMLSNVSTPPSANDGIMPSTGQWVTYYGLAKIPASGQVWGEFSVRGLGSILEVAQVGVIDLGSTI